MCGIVGYIGFRPAYPILINGLKRLEYRGYDSAGIALLNGTVRLYKAKGKVKNLEDLVVDSDISGTLGIAHTRWATHGEPNDINAHPHLSPSGKLALIHNGIIENYASIKQELKQRGYFFKSNTDTEVLVFLIEDIMVNEKVDLVTAVQMTLQTVVGAYAIAIVSKDDPDTIVAARKSSPLLIGIGKDEFFVASDATPIIEYTKEVVYLGDEEIAVLNRKNGLRITSITNVEKTPYVQHLELSLNALEKGGFPHFMLKEIYEQPRSIGDSMRGRLLSSEEKVILGGILEHQDKLVNAKRIIIVACGTSWHAGLVGEYLIEELCRIPVEVEYASEFRYRNPLIYKDDVVIAISQSGETADTLAAIELAKESGATIIGICNVVGSSISRATHAGSYTHAGPEIGVASTKAFTAQVTLLTLMALMIGKRRGTITDERYSQLLHDLGQIPEKVKQVLQLNDQIKLIAELFVTARHFLYLGRGINFPVALEGALKLKEISYIHAEGYPAAEMKHGPIALIDEEMPVFFLANNNELKEKVISNIQEVKARKGIVIALINEGDHSVNGLANFTIPIPETDELLSPLISAIPLQLLAYHIAVLRGCNVDQPRNLAKSVTVE
ncbi:MAG: glutamine--fructose-6-phosphate transaminase (isomerizing) [Bacteroidetes bacterium]|nr:glutamine--fructose-6-phosphate transaminase (isomerizing) [Bacteroidota bacterium]